MIRKLVLLNLLVIPLTIDGINTPLPKDIENDTCTSDGGLCGDDGDAHDGGTSGNVIAATVTASLKLTEHESNANVKERILRIRLLTNTL
jgi:hypothetical protein